MFAKLTDWWEPGEGTGIYIAVTAVLTLFLGVGTSDPSVTVPVIVKWVIWGIPATFITLIIFEIVFMASVQYATQGDLGEVGPLSLLISGKDRSEGDRFDDLGVAYVTIHLIGVFVLGCYFFPNAAKVAFVAAAFIALYLVLLKIIRVVYGLNKRFKQHITDKNAHGGK